LKKIRAVVAELFCADQ